MSKQAAERNSATYFDLKSARPFLHLGADEMALLCPRNATPANRSRKKGRQKCSNVKEPNEIDERQFSKDTAKEVADNPMLTTFMLHTLSCDPVYKMSSDLTRSFVVRKIGSGFLYQCYTRCTESRANVCVCVCASATY